jgi:hypothetical protein
MAGGGALKYAITNAYDALVLALQDASDKANVGTVEWIAPPSSCFRVDSKDEDLALLDATIHLAEWKAGSGTISILLRVREAIRRSTEDLVKSTVLVHYYGIKNKTATHLHSIHFDYDGEQDHHPVFHAQLCNDVASLAANDAEKLGFQYVRKESRPPCFKRARIPTSDMSLPSVLLCLAADHMKREFFMEFLESVKSVEEKMPLPAFERTKASLAGKPHHLRSSHWFAHMS